MPWWKFWESKTEEPVPEVPLEESDEEFREAAELERKRRESLLPAEIKQILRDAGIDPEAASEEDIVAARGLYFEKKRQEQEKLEEREAKSRTEERKLREKSEKLQRQIETGYTPEEEIRAQAYKYGLTTKEMEEAIQSGMSPEQMNAWLEQRKKEYESAEALRGERLKREKEEAAAAKWRKRGIKAGVILGGFAGTGYVAGKAATRASKALIPPRKAEEEVRRIYAPGYGKRISETYIPTPGRAGFYLPSPRVAERRVPIGEAPRVSTTPAAQLMVVGKPETRGIELGALRQHTIFRPIAVSPSVGFPKTYPLNLNKLLELQLPRSMRTIQPTTTPTPTPIGIREVRPSPELERYLRAMGYEAVEPYEGDVLFHRVPGKAELAREAWIVQMETGQYRFAGIGKDTGKPRSKIIGKDPGDAPEVAMKWQKRQWLPEQFGGRYG